MATHDFVQYGSKCSKTVPDFYTTGNPFSRLIRLILVIVRPLTEKRREREKGESRDTG